MFLGPSEEEGPNTCLAPLLDFFADSFGLLLILSLEFLCFFLCLLLRCCILISLLQSFLHFDSFTHLYYFAQY
jgi:hypothetical protein